MEEIVNALILQQVRKVQTHSWSNPLVLASLDPF
jgi:hypothetical protein